MRIPRTIEARVWLSAIAMLLTLPGPFGPASAAAQQSSAQPPVFGVQASTVVVDVVVRDRKDRLVRDLAAADFEVYEDGVRQSIDSLRVVDNGAPAAAADDAAGEPSPAPAPASGPPAAAPAAERAAAPPSVVAFVFDRLTTNARGLAKKAALAYTDRSYVPGDLVAVFSIDLALRTLQPFTSDVEDIRAGLERAGAQANTSFANEREEARNREDEADRAAASLASLGAADSAAAGALAGALATQLVAEQMRSDMLRAFDAMERDQQGFATTHGLMAVVNGLKAIPGRKTVVFFSEGIAVTSSVEGQFRSAIAAANRASVSVYAIDAGGLRIDSGTREAREEVVRSATTRLRQEEAGGAGRPPREALSRGMERSEEALRLDPQSGLGELADETGGFLVRNTNDLRAGFGRIAEDMRFHYLLSYAPTNDKMDGRYRTISVRVARSGLHVQSRKGYFAVRPEYVLPVRGYEAPALASLDRTPRPDAFPIGVAVLSFPETDRPGLAPVLVSVPAGAVRWAPQASGGAHADFSVVVRLKDEQGREADRLSQQYLLDVPAGKLGAGQRGDVLFYREARLRPGRYTAEAVAYDAIAGEASVRTAPLEVPVVADGRLRLSSLMLVSRAERLSAAEQEQKSPLHFGEAMLYPSMGEPFKKAATPALGFYFSLYGGQGASAKATIELRQGERSVATLPAALSAPDASGRIQYAGTLPLQSLPPGRFTLKVSVSDGVGNDTRESPFTVE